MHKVQKPLHSKKSVISWALYDVANTVFNMGVVGLFLPLSINATQGTTDVDMGFPIAISMVIVLVLSPFIGALTDQLKGRVRTFTLLNIIAAVSICLIGLTGSLQASLVFFSMAFVSVYLAELVYNAMLVETSTPENRGKVGGLAIGLGFVGALAVILGALHFVGDNPSYSLAFLGISIIFILTALPLTVFFVESHKYHSDDNRITILNATWNQIKRTWGHFAENPKLRMFFIARFFYMIAVTTASTFAVLYGLNTIGFSEREVELVFLAGILVAIPSAVLWGYIVDKIGPSSALKWNLLGWILILSISVSIPWMNLTNQLWWGLSVITGFCFGGLWVADRPLLIQLSSSKTTSSKLGEMFGFYGSVSRLAFLTGSFAWPFISVIMGLGQPAAIFFLLCCSLVGLGVLIMWVAPKDKLPVT